MVKIGPVGEYDLIFHQELVPENEDELNKLMKVCLENKYYFAFIPLDEPAEVTTAIGKVVFKANWFILVNKTDAMDIVDKVESEG